jgi:molybdate transport system substrate-binding protein
MLKDRSRTLGIAVFLTLSLLSALPLALMSQPGHAGDEAGPTVFAAASLKTALDAVAGDWQTKTGRKPVIAYAATPALAKHIEQGAEADIFISADQAWMDYVADRGLIVPQSRFDLLGNRLALIAPKDSEISIRAEPVFPLAELLGDGRLAIAGVDAVPAGKYGKAALESLGVWDTVKDKLAQSENVRGALRLVARGETPLGIVYASDAAADPTVKIVSLFPEHTHKPIVYPAARLRTAGSTDGEGFLAFLRSPEAAARLAQFGLAAVAKVQN